MRTASTAVSRSSVPWQRTVPSAETRQVATECPGALPGGGAAPPLRGAQTARGGGGGGRVAAQGWRLARPPAPHVERRRHAGFSSELPDCPGGCEDPTAQLRTMSPSRSQLRQPSRGARAAGQGSGRARAQFMSVLGTAEGPWGSGVTGWRAGPARAPPGQQARPRPRAGPPRRERR